MGHRGDVCEWGGQPGSPCLSQLCRVVGPWSQLSRLLCSHEVLASISLPAAGTAALVPSCLLCVASHGTEITALPLHLQFRVRDQSQCLGVLTF